MIDLQYLNAAIYPCTKQIAKNAKTNKIATKIDKIAKIDKINNDTMYVKLLLSNIFLSHRNLTWLDIFETIWTYLCLYGDMIVCPQTNVNLLMFGNSHTTHAITKTIETHLLKDV